MSWSVRLERLVSIAIVLAAVAFIGTHVRLWFHAHPSPSAPRPAYQSGDVVPAFAKLASTDRVLILFVNSNCVYCTQSMPFYDRLNEALGNSSELSIGATSRQSIDVTQSYLRTHAVDIQRVVNLGVDDASQLRLTPTVILAKRDGRVDKLWTGKLDAAGEEELLELARNARGSATVGAR